MDVSPKTFTIPNELCRKAGIAATWLPVNQLGIFAYQHVVISGQDKSSMFSPCNGTVHQIRQEIILFEPILRKLINESNGTFIELQNIVKERNIDTLSELIKLSRQYRSIIRACLENLQDKSIKASLERKEELSNYITIFYSIECLWHLCEILFVETIPGNMVLYPLLDWVRFHFPRHERAAARILSGDLQSVETNPEYWDTVIGSLMQGRIDITRALLKLHNASDSAPFKLVDATLKAMPIYDVYGGVSVTEFHVRWKHWQVDVQSKIDAKLFMSDRHLNLMMRLTIGEEIAWEEVKPKFESWYELLACWLYFTEPTVKSYELGQYAKLWLTRFRNEEQMRHLDYVVLAVLENDLLQIIKEIQFMSENGWFVAHLTDLLYHCGRLDVLDKKDKEVSSQVRESFLIDYGTVLMENKSLWQVALSYFDYCPSQGLNTIEHLLPRLPFDNENRAIKIIREAQKRNLIDVVSSICKIQGMKSLKNGRIGNALTWAIRSQDGMFTSYLADRFLKEYCATGKITNTDLLDNLGSCMLVSDKLIFLGKYCEFHKVFQERNFTEAANLLISLIASRITPKYFWLTLLLDSLILLECDELILSSNDTLTLLHCLEERLDFIEIKGDKENKEKIEMIRLALARNLARALIAEAQTPS